jgi:cytochrome c-type biogenesis protein CcmH
MAQSPIRSLFLALVIIAASLPALAVQPHEVLKDPAMESRARSLSAGLRCLVCQNQSIDDSDAPLAQDLRRLVRERLVAGDSDREVKDFVVARYGEFVLLKPPFNTGTLLLWLSPALVLLLGAFGLWRMLRRRPVPAIETPVQLSAPEQAALARLTGRDDAGPAA